MKFHSDVCSWGVPQTYTDPTKEQKYHRFKRPTKEQKYHRFNRPEINLQNMPSSNRSIPPYIHAHNAHIYTCRAKTCPDILLTPSKRHQTNPSASIVTLNIKHLNPQTDKQLRGTDIMAAKPLQCVPERAAQFDPPPMEFLGLLV